MSDTDLRDLLHDQRRHEPAFTLDPATTIRAGHRRRLVRTTVVGLAAAAVIGAAGAGVATLAPGGAGETSVDRSTDVAGSAQGQQASPPPATQPDEPLGDYLRGLVADTFGPHVADLPRGELTVLAPPDRTVSQSDVTAQHFSALYRTADRTLTVGVISRPAEVGVPVRCAGQPLLYSSCLDTPRPDGSVLSVAVGPTSDPETDGGFRTYTARQTRDLEGDLFFRRSVTLTTPDGVNVYADEFVRADTVAAAEAAWAVPTEAMEAFVTDAGLTAYPLPHASWH